MFNVNNGRTILKLSYNIFVSNRTRNFFAVVAILLTSILFTSSFAIGGSIISSMQESLMRQVGGDFHGGFKYLTKQEYDRIKNHESIEVISYSVVLAIAENEALEKRATEIRFTNDETNAKGLFSLPTTGRLPEHDDELATDTLVLEKLGVPAKIGEKVTLEYTLGDEKRTETFRLVGFWEGDILMSASQVWLNRSFVEKELETYGSEENEIIGSINADVKFSNTQNLEEKMLRIIKDSGFSNDDIAFGVNWAYTFDSEGTIGSFMAIGLFIVLIIFCGYLMISNIFYINVAKDVKYYGLLKTLGTTAKQIKTLIRLQVLYLSFIAIPMGLMIGKMVGVLLVPTTLSLINVNVINDTVNPMIYLLSGFFTVLTIFLSISKPSKIAAKVSPIEALRRSDTDRKYKKGRTKRFKREHTEAMSVKLSKMALRNVLRNKKKMVLVTISLSLGLILLNMTFSLSNSFDMDAFVKEMIGSDFVVGDLSNFNTHLYYKDQRTLSTDFYDFLDAQNGIESRSDIYFHEIFVSTDDRLLALPQKIRDKLGNSYERMAVIEQALTMNQQILHIYGLDENGFDRLKWIKGSFDYEKLKSGNYVLISPHENLEEISYYQIGDRVTLPDAQGIEKEYEVIGIADIPYNISIKHSHGITPTFFMASEAFLSQIQVKSPMLTTINVSDHAIESMELFLTRYVSQVDQNLMYQSKATVIKEYEKTQIAFKTIGLALSLVLALIGIMNYINTVMTSIHSRRLEFAMSESIGMTRKQTRFMLVAESLITLGLTFMITLTVGSVMSVMMLRAISEGSFFIRAYYTALPSLYCAPFLVVMAVYVTLLSQRHVYKTSVIERLREVV